MPDRRIGGCVFQCNSCQVGGLMVVRWVERIRKVVRYSYDERVVIPANLGL